MKFNIEFIVGISSLLIIVISIAKLILWDIYQLLIYKKTKIKKNIEYKISIVIPAHNEEKTIQKTVLSALGSIYKKKEIIVINDGSTDDTLRILKEIQLEYKNLIIIDKSNEGKASALNTAIFKYVTGDIVVILDADTKIDKRSLSEINLTFQNPEIIAASSNIRIAHPKKFIEWYQFYEYIYSCHSRGTQSMINSQYVIGGAGSIFRTDILKSVNGYKLNTLTEDIDMTLKIIQKYGNTKHSLGYISNSILYTDPVHNINDLVKQRYRWKLGLFIALYKYKSLIFQKTKIYSKLFTFVVYPLQYLSIFLSLFTPILTLSMIVAIFSLSFNLYLLLTILFGVMTYITLFNEPKITHLDKIKLTILAPAAVIISLMYSYVEVISLYKVVKTLIINGNNTDEKGTWDHVSR